MKLLFQNACIYGVDRSNILLLFILVAFSECKLYSQSSYESENLFVTAFTNEDGLRQSMVSQVCQDERGLIWMVTGDGLHYFDGQEFRSFRVPDNAVYYQIDNVMRSLTVSKQGELAITSTSSLLRFNTASARFSVVYRKEGICPVLLNTSIDGNPLVWIRGLNFCLLKNNRLIPLKFINDNKVKVPSDLIPIRAVWTGKDELLISSEQGIIAVQLTANSDDSVFNIKWVPVAGCHNIVKTSKGRTLVLAGGKIFTWQKGGKMILYKDTKLNGLKNIFTDANENIWLTDQDFNKIYRLTGSKVKEINLYTHIGKTTEILTPSIISIFEDREHNLWFGTDGNGVLLYSPNQLQFQKAIIGFIRCVTPYNNNIWAGTFNNGLWELSPDLSEAKRINPAHFNNRTYFLDLIADKSGRLWIVTRNGLEVIDSQGRNIWKYPFQCLQAKFVYQSADTMLLIYDNQLLRIKPSKSPALYSANQYISIRSLLTVGDYYWVGSSDGIFRYEKKQGTRYGINFNSKDIKLSSVPVYSLLFYKGHIWAATGNGIECYHPDGTVHKLSACFNSLKNDVIYTIMPDDSGRMWITGNNGIGCIIPAEDRVIFFSARNNLQSLEFNFNASCTYNGNFYFGGIQGLNHIQPTSFGPDKIPPVVQLVSLYVSDSAYSSCIPPADLVFKLSLMAPHISGRVFSTDYVNAGSLLYSFYLEGYQSEWSKQSNSAVFTYRNLPPGEYRLFVKCADPYMNWSKPALLLSFSIAQPFYKTWWFLVLLTLSIIGITIIVVKRVQKVKYQDKLREIEREFAVEKERTRISKDMHDEVGASLTRISILSELAKQQQNQPAKALKTIDQISEISGGVVDEMSEIIWAMNPRNDTLDSFASYIRQYISGYLETVNIDSTFSFPDEIPSHFMSSELRRNLFLTVKEAVHNVVKHAGASKVHTELSFSEHLLRVAVADNGKGFDEKKIKSWGNGLINMRKRMEESGGTFVIETSIISGTKIKMEVNLGNKSNSH